MNTDLNKYLSFLSKLSYGKRLQPARDWFVLVSLALLALGALAVVSVWMYLEGARPTGEGEVPTLTPAFSVDALDKTEALFEKRAEERSRYEAEYLFVDPSLPAS